jgi:hypothetical protein
MKTAKKPPVSHTEPTAAIELVANENLLVTYRTICEGKLHRVSIHRNGQIVFHDHNRDEIKLMLKFLKLGGECCRCVQVARCYIKAETDPSIPVEFTRERRPSNSTKKVAWHIHNRRQRQHDLVSTFSRLPTLDPAYLANRVCDELRRRGIKAKTNHDTGGRSEIWVMRKPDDGEKGGQMLLCIRAHGGGYIIASESSYGGGVCTIGNKNRENPPIRYLADVVERRLYSTMVENACQRNSRSTSELVDNRCEELDKILTCYSMTSESENYKEMASVDFQVKVDSAHKSTVMISMTAGELTLQAAKLIVDELNKVQEKIKAYARASNMRLPAPHRFPPVPAGGIGWKE